MLITVRHLAARRDSYAEQRIHENDDRFHY